MPAATELFQLTLSPWEIILRGSAVYWFLFVLFRFALRRDVGSLAITDVLFVVLVADASQNAMAGEYRSLADGAVLVLTLGAWNYALDWAAFRFAMLHRLVHGQPVMLVRSGKVLRRNMRRELLTMDELMSALRTYGLDDVSQVDKAFVESDGDISVVPIRRKGEQASQ